MPPNPSILRISRLGLSSFQKKKLGLEAAQTKLTETTRKLKRASEFRSTLDFLLESKIDFWVMKGIELSFRNYGDPMARTFGDLDILIPEKVQVGQLRKYLLDKGWFDRYENEWIEDQPRRDWYMDLRHHISMIDPVNKISIELHWQLDYQFLKMPENQLQQILFEETEKINVLNREINVLKPELEFVFLLSHGTRHAWSNFKWIIDLYHFPIDSLNKEKLTKWIDSFKLQKLLLLHNALESYFFETNEITPPIAKTFLFKFCVFRIEYSHLNLPISISTWWKQLYFDLSLVRRFSEIFEIIDRSVIRPTDIFEVKLPFRFLYYFYRPIGMFFRYNDSRNNSNNPTS